MHILLANSGMQQFQALRERSVDLVIGRMPQPFVEDDLETEILFDEPFQAVVGAASRMGAPPAGRACRSLVRALGAAAL